MSVEKERIRELVARCLAQLDEHGSTVVDEVCREAPDLADAVRRRLATLERAGLVGPGASKDDSFPDQLGEFKLLRRIGGGGMGVVYLAEQTSLGRIVALKLVRPELLYFPGARERFRREVDAVAKLRHPNVVPIYTYSDRAGEAADVPYYAMEWVDGASLDEVLHLLRGRRPESLGGADLHAALNACREARAADQLPIEAQPEVGAPASPASPSSPFAATSWVDVCFRLVGPAALALEHAHQQGVIHRDLKPSNLMLTHDGRVLLVDFGLASTRGTTRLTKTGAQLGSLPYTAPEQLEGGSDAVDEKSDVYSLGLVLYELLTLAPAYGAPDATPESTRQQILAGEARPIRERNPSVQWDAETVCLVAMERDPARRYASAAAFAADLGNVLHRKPIAARRPGAALRVRRLAQRHPAASVAVALGVLLVIAVLGVYAWQQKRRSDDLVTANERLAAQVAREQKATRRARGAIRDFLVQVGTMQLANVPGAEKLRKELLEQSVREYEELLAEEDSSEIRLELAFALGQLGLREESLGDVPAARGRFERALALLEGEGAPPLATTPARVTHASLVGDFANFESIHGARGAALPRLRRAEALWAALASEEPGGRLELGHLNSLASLVIEPSVPIEEAGALAEKVVASADALAKARPGDPVPQERAAIALVSLGTRCDSMGEEVRALALLRDAVRRLAALEAAVPGRVELRGNLVKSLLQLGQLERTRNLLEDSRGSLEDALRVATLLTESFPARPEFASLAGSAAMALAECLHDLGADADAIAHHRRARDHFAAARALAPDQPRLDNDSGANERVFAALLVDAGAVEEARDAIRRALASTAAAAAAAPDDPWFHLEVAEAWLVVAKQEALRTKDEDAVDCAERAFDAASAALALDPTGVDFASCAREAAALAIEILLERGGGADRARADALQKKLAATIAE